MKRSGESCYRCTVFDASADGASENCRVLCTYTAYDVIIFKFQGGGEPPQVAPFPGAYDCNVLYMYDCTCVTPLT